MTKQAVFSDKLAPPAGPFSPADDFLRRAGQGRTGVVPQLRSPREPVIKR